MNSVGSTEEEVKLNTPVPAPHLNIYKAPSSLKEAWNPAAVSIVSSDNTGSEYDKNIVRGVEGSDDGTVKPYSPSVI